MTAPDQRPERRRAQRIALGLSATIREPRRGRVSIRVVDISAHGCRIETTCAAFSEQWLWLSIAGLETQYCRVVWHDSGFAGLEFAAPLNAAVLDALITSQSAGESTIVKLQELAGRAHQLALRSTNPLQAQPLVDLSRECAEWAVIQGLMLRPPKEEKTSRLSSSMIRRSVQANTDD